jgi:hypothetical protein
MKNILLATALICALSGAAHADQNSLSEIQKLQISARQTYVKADLADAQGDHAGAALLRKQAHALEIQAQNLHLQDQNIDDAANAIAGAFSSN